MPAFLYELWMGVMSSQNGIHLTLLCNFNLSIENFPNTDNSLTSQTEVSVSKRLKMNAMECPEARKEMLLMMGNAIGQFETVNVLHTETDRQMLQASWV